MSFGRPLSNRRGRARYSLVVITLCGVSALGKSLGWSTTMTQPVMAGLLWAGPRASRPRSREARMSLHTEYRFGPVELAHDPEKLQTFRTRSCAKSWRLARYPIQFEWSAPSGSR